jgi:hypothetical protein
MPLTTKTPVALIGTSKGGNGSDRGFNAGLSVGEVNVEDIRDQIIAFRDAFAPVMDGESEDLPLNSVTLTLGITASGKVGVIVADASLEVSGTIELTFARP